MVQSAINSLSIASIIGIVLSVILIITVFARFTAHSSSDTDRHYDRLAKFRYYLIGQFERRALGLAFLCVLSNVLNLIIAVRGSENECEVQLNGTSVFPSLSWLAFIMVPVSYVHFIIPSIVACTSAQAATGRKTEKELDLPFHRQDLPENYPEINIQHKTARARLVFILRLLAYASTLVVFWLPVYLIYTNDWTAYSSCFTKSGSAMFYMGSATAIAGSVLLLGLLGAIACGFMYAVGHASVVANARDVFRGYRGASCAYLGAGFIYVGLVTPEILYRATLGANAQQITVPRALQSLTVVAMPIHVFLLCVITFSVFIFVQSEKLNFCADDDNKLWYMDTTHDSTSGSVLNDRADEHQDKIQSTSSPSSPEKKSKLPYFSMTFHASPRYEDKYVSGVSAAARHDRFSRTSLLMRGLRWSTSRSGSRADLQKVPTDEPLPSPSTLPSGYPLHGMKDNSESRVYAYSTRSGHSVQFENNFATDNILDRNYGRLQSIIYSDSLEDPYILAHWAIILID
ncbi:uncharacterized protein V1516DRAFT_684479 [Lipomyces oligophaga]|uniref:uncharacterized protein n=1 Tax=Lipomyces oligophaga TaxID=45792 RepID=UPI0034CD0449